VGVYQDGAGKVPVLKTVREAEKRWYEKEDSKSYLPIDGVPAYNKQVQALLFGADSPVLAGQRAVTVQALGGTGALRVGADFLHRFFPNSGIWISNPSWENHRALFEAAGFQVQNYPYYDPRTHGLDFEAMKDGLKSLTPKSIVLLHASCHNPTGVDLSGEQWEEVAQLVAAQDLVAFLDFAYQGFFKGVDEDGVAVRTFAKTGIPFIVSSSFSKNFSLYRERVGALTIVTADAGEAKRVLSQVKRVIRTNWSNPSSHGAQVVAMVLSDPELRAQWVEEVREMRERIQQMRKVFVQALKDKGVPRDFSFIEQQNGMFSFSGLNVDAVRRLRSEFSLYIVDSGRICVAAMNQKNIGYVCDAIAHVLK
jgi:aromatic-amino-acid transaminase